MLIYIRNLSILEFWYLRGLLEPVAGPHLCPLHGYLKMIVKPSWSQQILLSSHQAFRAGFRTLEPPAWAPSVPLYNRHREAPVLLQLVAGPTRKGQALKQALEVKSERLVPSLTLLRLLHASRVLFWVPHPVSLYSLYHVDLSPLASSFFSGQFRLPWLALKLL